MNAKLELVAMSVASVRRLSIGRELATVRNSTLALLRSILEDGADVPAMRLRRLVQAFVRSECDDPARPTLHRQAIEQVIASQLDLFRHDTGTASAGLAAARYASGSPPIVSTGAPPG